MNCIKNDMWYIGICSIAGADDVDADSVNITENLNGGIMIHWTEPASPNGAILTYQLEYQHASTDQVWIRGW